MAALLLAQRVALYPLRRIGSPRVGITFVASANWPSILAEALLTFSVGVIAVLAIASVAAAPVIFGR